MSKVLRYFLFSSLVLSVLFLASCEDDGEGPADPSSISVEQNGTAVDTISAVLPGDQITVDVGVEFGSEEPEILRVFGDDGTQIGNDYPIAQANTAIQINFSVPEDASGEYIVTFETFDGDDVSIAEEELVLEVYGTVVDVATLSDDFSILVEALTNANLVTTLQGDGPFTVFAPTNAAFADMGINSAADLPEGEELNQILLYHVVSGAAVASGDLEAKSYPTVEGSDIDVTLDNGVFINGTAEVTTADIMAGNGIVHVIDEVLMPGASIIYDEAVLLGGQLNTTDGSFYNVLDSLVYTSADASDNNDKIDFVYWYTETSESIIGSPDNQFAQAAFPGTDLGDGNANQTRFTALADVTEDDFDAVNSANDLDDIYDGDLQDVEERLTGLQVGQVFGFILDAGRGGNVGIVKVLEISGDQGSNRAIRIGVKTRKQ
ncbi:fasciclin domain-containing protein [Porifericola rhodea]|uniref:fasciclin domain-containing protein n=1 Tax=Porifericola rhodea TaxID=930972 RepID=UPI002666E55D|nr:fasciclin domain-containing protein [Porifericola rhodea]WKN33380.1 fasciclin domain-containing protein [Porifericola rhodea]